jgi:hypothetical protein
MINQFETVEINPGELAHYLNMGYEFVCPVIDSYVNMQSVQEEVPDTRTVTQSSSGSYYNHQPTYINKHYPVAEITTKILLKRTVAARLLYEKSLKNENNTRNSS